MKLLWAKLLTHNVSKRAREKKGCCSLDLGRVSLQQSNLSGRHCIKCARVAIKQKYIHLWRTLPKAMRIIHKMYSEKSASLTT
jgi:hypothetical protein